MRLENGLRNLTAALACAGLLAAASADAATIVIVNNDGAGEGFNDPTPVAPVGGNPGVTLGAQRLAVFQHAANIWGALLPSAVTIQVRAQFNPQTCTATSATLGSAGPVTIHGNFAGAPFANTWYHAALANRLNGADLSAANPDINATFNSNLGLAGCGFSWYYGLDGNEGTATELLPVVLHELGHGLGFSTTTSGTTGNFNGGFPSIYDRFLFDFNTLNTWHAITAAQRVASAIGCNKLAWDGPSVRSSSGLVLGPKSLLRVNGGAANGDYEVGAASFGPVLSTVNLTGDVVLYEDALAPINDGCEAPPVNAAALVGKIALIDRGTCGFVVKVKNAQDAGAIAVIIADNVAGCVAGMGGADPTITIPSVRITLADGNILKAALGGGVNATILSDPSLLAGGTHGNRVLMYTPNPFQSGSSVSHFDTSAEPNLLMEPAINNSLHDTVDLTLNQMADIGWLDAATSIALAPGYINVGSRGVRIEWYSSDASNATWSAERTVGETGTWETIAAPTLVGRAQLVLEDAAVQPGTDYGYRLVGRNDAETFTSEIVWVSTPDAGEGLALAGAIPNPSTGGRMNVSLTLPGVGRAQLDLVNVAGRIVRSIDLSGRAPGPHTIALNGDRTLPAGTYFLRLSQGGNTVTKPVVVLD